jgi:glyoxylase-like metal-dependent hydrolase (beta-lactamase superfamily II)
MAGFTASPILHPSASHQVDGMGNLAVVPRSNSLTDVRVEQSAERSRLGSPAMADLLELAARIIDDRVTDEPVNRVTNQLSELGDGLAIVESFSHCVALRTGDELVAFDASGVATGAAVVDALRRWTPHPVRHLVYTHGHADHIGGSGAFAGAYGAPTVIGHENVARRIDRYETTSGWNVAINARQFGGIRADRQLTLGLGDTDGDGSGDGDVVGAPGVDASRWRRFLPRDVLRPDVEVDDRRTLEVGGDVVELVHARGETDDHLWAWLPERRTVIAGDFLIWNFPNAGNPQKVQRYPIEWAAALRAMAACEPELLVPAHGLPIPGRDRIATVLTTIADTLEQLVADVLAMMNDDATLDEIVHTVRVPADTLALPYLRPLYDEPEFVVRNVWRQFGGWWDGAASRLKPARDADLAAVLAELAGGAAVLAARAERAASEGDFRLAGHLADLAGWAAPDDAHVHRTRAAVYRARRSAEPSLMSKGIFAAAARESEAIAEAATTG